MAVVKLLACSTVLVAAAAVLTHRWLLDTPLPEGIEDPAPLRSAVAIYNFVFYTGAAVWMAGATRRVLQPVKFLAGIFRGANAAVEFPGLESTVELVARKDGTQLSVKLDRPKQLQHQQHQPPTAAMLYLHGGGYTLSSPAVYHPLTGNLSLSLNLPVFTPDYRKSPEWTHPAALDDALAAMRHLRDNADRYNIDPDRIVLAGDSAGAHLSIGVTLSLLKADQAAPAALVLIYPATQLLSCCLPSHLENRLNPFLPESTATAFRLSYLVGDTADVPVLKANNHSSAAMRAEFAERFQLPALANPCHHHEEDGGGGEGLGWAIERYRFAYEDWLLSPLFAPEDLLAAFPPTLTQTCQFDLLRDEGRMFHERLLRAGAGRLAHRQYASVHGMYAFARAGHAPALAALRDFSEFVRSVMRLSRPR